MRIAFFFKTKKLPFIYRHRMLSFIKKCIDGFDDKLREKLYDDENRKKKKLFTFAVYPPLEHRIEDSVIQIDDNYVIRDKVFVSEEGLYKLIVSSADHKVIWALYGGYSDLFKDSVFDFSADDNMLVNGEKVLLEFTHVKYLNKKIRYVEKGEVLFKTLSPIYLKDENGKPVLFKDKRFVELLNHSLDRTLTRERGFGLRKSLEFIPVNMKEKIVKHTLKDFREKTGRAIMYLETSVGTFVLKGDRRDLEFIYDAGLGHRTGQGFGLLEVV